MASFGIKSRKKLEDLDFEFKRVLEEAVRDFDFSVVWTHRGEAAQNRANEEGWSKLRWPNSKHNKKPAKAVDIAPYPDGYEASYKQFFEMATYVFAAASRQRLRIRWGGHWKNYTGKGENDRDWAHFELLD